MDQHWRVQKIYICNLTNAICGNYTDIFDLQEPRDMQKCLNCFIHKNLEGK